MGGNEDGAAVGGELPQQPGDGCLGAFVHAGERFVEEHHGGALGDAPGHEGTLLLAAGQLPDLPVRELGEFHPVQGELDGGAVRLGGAAGETLVPVAAHHHHVADGQRELPVNVFALRDVADAAFPARLGG